MMFWLNVTCATLDHVNMEECVDLCLVVNTNVFVHLDSMVQSANTELTLVMEIPVKVEVPAKFLKWEDLREYS